MKNITNNHEKLLKDAFREAKKRWPSSGTRISEAGVNIAEYAMVNCFMEGVRFALKKL